MTDPRGRRVPLLLAVDGVLALPATAASRVPDQGADEPVRTEHQVIDMNRTPRRLLVDPRAGEWLRGLTDVFELVWATRWGNADEVISPLLGLPSDLARVPLPDLAGAVALRDDWSPKVPYIRWWATENGVERLAWVDTGTGPLDTRVLMSDYSRHYGNPMRNDPPLLDVLALKVAPGTGLTERHVAELRRWAGVPIDR